MDIQPVNFNFGDVDTNVFDTDVVVLPVSKRALGIEGEASSPLTYVAGTYDYVRSATLDRTAPIEYDANQPAVDVAGPLFVDAGGTAIDYTLGGAAGSDAEALVLHLHGMPGRRAEVVDLAP